MTPNPSAPQNARRKMRAGGFWFWFACLTASVGAAADAASPGGDALAARLRRGQELYAANCAACHQLNGEGVAGVFPPLAASDFLADGPERGIRAVCEGLAGEIVVNGRTYAGVMPPVVIDDADVADVFTYVMHSWGNPGGVVEAERVRRIRSRTAVRTFERLQASSVFPPLPPPPPGFTLREVARLPQRGVRIASDGTGRTLFVLTEKGDVWALEPATGALRQVLSARKYLEQRPGDLGPPLFVLGLALDGQGRLYIASNQQNEAALPVQNIVTIYRTTTQVDGLPAEPKPWFQISYPGNSAYVHGVEHLAFGPDGLLYVGNGARTDGGQPTTGPRWHDGAETPLTASIWRLDPRVERPQVEIIARGVRNAYGFCWNERGEMIATENGPDADAPEELNLIEPGRHYGFPYAFADWTKKAYPHTPDAPPGLQFTRPIPNVGPDGGFAGEPLFTFDPHSCPGGIVYLGDDFPPGYRGTYVLARFGNLIGTGRDRGFDVLQATLTRDPQGQYQAAVKTLLAPLGRPIDVHLGGRGKLYICEFSRATSRAMSYALPGRILELAVAQHAAGERSGTK
ncbi:PQQ-dependent sugar dehydrogenase [Horticoccus sp. 23ND18S-11]|uniref:PQQ-dependent sugar dehydrogenase n=1 Tax=Horticoccus sp. 23ND18S-11 TaxID=3391832 RepID=UPI0039C9E70D